ncbi:helix-turn-helix domain-containing protein [Plebeiibacterium sediminum]|uniref:Helix-turn-helix transcriptional regulator n=1 Tax=Plebeiibacterium sediminum TaxID=2992112 RepID=A0AAE3M7T0_9BACT|nr:helix-turn-helix transcriptional regulator [Plebeiobacterium sediminum]MCW3788517.1 helix-turn-helix transcriptional regulator [Plebeiobacterium sediminum]
MFQYKISDLPEITIDTLTYKLISNETKYNYHYLSNWVDLELERIFYLFEAPNIDTANSINNFINDVSLQIIEVNKLFTDCYFHQIRSNRQNLQDQLSPKIIVAFCFNFLSNKDDDNISLKTLKYFKYTEHLITKHKGVIIEKHENSMVCLFNSAKDALKCTLKTRNVYINDINDNTFPPIIKIGIGISNSKLNPENDQVFINDIDHTKNLCSFSIENQLIITGAFIHLFKKEAYKLIDHSKEIRFLSLDEENFILQLIPILEKSLNTPKFSIRKLTLSMGLSKSKFYRTIVSITGISPQDFINEYKLFKAMNLIISENKNISEIAYETGFGSPSYFSKCFKNRFSITPSKLNDIYSKNN